MSQKIRLTNAVEMNLPEHINEHYFVDIHTHKGIVQENTLQITNILSKEIASFKLENDQFYSIGHHPWHIGEIKDYVQKIIHLSGDKKIIAIGEMGLDRFISEPIEKQLEIFIKQLQLAESYSKPVIIHCVRAFSDLFAYLKNNRPSVPMIIHGFNENSSIANDLLAYKAYLSFGHQLLNKQSKAYHSFISAPPDRIFLESDQSNHSIEEIYKAASSLKKISVEQLKNQIFINFKRCFNISQ